MTPYKTIPVETFIGKKHFQWLKAYREPTYGMTTLVEITEFYNFVKKNGYPVYLSLVYLVTKALNEVVEFRYRYDGTDIRLYDWIDPAFTVMTNLGLYDNCDNVHLRGTFVEYLEDAAIEVASIKSGVHLTHPQVDERCDQFYISSSPWIEFLAITHPMNDTLFSYIPRIAWDKFHFEDNKVTMHLNIVVHHALISGKPLADGFLKIQEFLRNPSLVLK